MVTEGEWGRTRAALAAVDANEIGALARLVHALGEFGPERSDADGGLDSGRDSGRRCDVLAEVNERRDVVERAMSIGAEHGDADLDSAGFGDLWRDLPAGQYTAKPRLCALAEFEFDGFDIGGSDRLDQFVEGEGAVGVSGAEIAGSQLQDERSAVAVMIADAALAGVVEATRNLRTAIERLDRLGGERAKRHRRHIDRRFGLERFGPAVSLAEHLSHREEVGLVFRRWFVGKRSMAKHDVSRLGQVVVGAEAKVGVLLFGRGIDEAPLVAAKGQLFVVVGHHVLAKFWPDLLNEETEVPDDGEVAKDRMLALGYVVNCDDNEEDRESNEYPQPPRHGEIVGSR